MPRFDANSREHSSPPLRTIEFTYDPAGRLSAMDLRFAYHGLLPTSTRWDGFDVNGEVAYTYNNSLQAVQQSISGGASPIEHHLLDPFW